MKQLIKKLLIVFLLSNNFVISQNSFWFDNVVYPEVDTKDLIYSDSLHTTNCHDMETYRQLLYRYINWERKQCDLDSLIIDETLMIDSQCWANYMAKWNKYRHTGKNVIEIINRGHAIWYITHRESASICVGSWMDSPAHRDAILDPDLKWIGIGVAEGVNPKFVSNTYFIVQFKY